MQAKVVYCLLGWRCVSCEMDTNCYIQARGKCPVPPPGYVNFTKVIFRPIKCLKLI